MAILGSSSLTGCNSIPDFIATGSLMLFQQSAAPVNWTKETDHSDKALRVVTGPTVPGGTSPFSNVFASKTITGTVGNTTLSEPQLPKHSHPVSQDDIAGRFQSGMSAIQGPEGLTTAYMTVGATGGGGSHNHPFPGVSLDFAVQYVDVIICSKN